MAFSSGTKKDDKSLTVLDKNVQRDDKVCHKIGSKKFAHAGSSKVSELDGPQPLNIFSQMMQNY